MPTERASRARLIAAFAAVYIVWGSTYLAIRYGVETIPPFLMVGSRFLVSGLLLIAWVWLRGSERPTPRHWRAATITGLLLLCGGNGSVALAERHVPSSIAALLVAVVPLWMVLIDWLRPGGVRPKASVWIGVGVGLAGLYLLVGPDLTSSRNSATVYGAAVLMAGSLSWAAGSVYSRYGQNPKSASLATGMQMLCGAVGLMIMSVATGELRGFHLSQVSTASALGWVYLVTMGSLVGFTAYTYLLQATTPAKAATYAYVNPLVAVFLGWAVAGERITARTLIAAGVILGGVALITLGRTTQR